MWGRFNNRNSGQYNKTYNTRHSNYSSPAYSTPPAYKEQSTPPHQQYQPPQQQYQPPQQQQEKQFHPPPQQQQEKQFHPPPQQQEKTQPAQAAPPKTPPQEPPKVNPPPTAELKPENHVQPEDVKVGGEDEDGKKKLKTWMKRRTPDVKIPRRIRKRRQNARLKNLLAPKNAMMVLHELHPELKMIITEQVSAANQMTYVVEIEIEGKIYKGMGMSKMAAKQAGSEAALKGVLLKKLEENAANRSAAGAKEDGGWEEDVTMTDVNAMKQQSSDGAEEEQNGTNTPKQRAIPEDDVPWGSLASFALFKLFTEWQSQGFQLPAVSGLQNVVHPKPQQVPHTPTPMKRFPEDAHLKHPVQLLNQIRPGTQYVENREGNPPNLVFTITITIDGLNFKGVGTSKKEAKKLCAKHALEHMGVVYPSNG